MRSKKPRGIIGVSWPDSGDFLFDTMEVFNLFIIKKSVYYQKVGTFGLFDVCKFDVNL
jgi:hypothetical protein